MERTFCFGRANAVRRGERCKIRFLRPFVGADDKESKLLTAICRGGRLCPPSKFVDFSWIFVGADAHIGPLKCCGFASDFHKTGQFRRADRVVRPYGEKRKTDTDSPEGRHKPAISCGSMWASTPTTRNGRMLRFSEAVCRGRCPHRPVKMLRIRIGFP